MRILILHAGALGDCVLTIHVAAGMRRKGHHVTLAARSSIARWAARRGIIDNAIPLDQLGIRLWKDSSSESSDFCRGKTFDCYVSFLGGPGDHVTERMCEQIGEDDLIALDPRPRKYSPHAEKHIVQQWLLKLGSYDFRISLDGALSGSAAALASINRRLRGNLLIGAYEQDLRDQAALESLNAMTTGPPRALQTTLIHPGSGGRAKCCPLEVLEMLMKRLIDREVRVRWMIGPDEMERDGPSLVQRLESTAPVVYLESVELAADFVATADAYIGNDSGMTHVAALLGVKTVALFGPTDPRVWRPLGRSCTPLSFPASGADLSPWCDSVMHVLEWEFTSTQAGKLRAAQ